MNRPKAIRDYCKQCSGSTKEVTLCHLFDCPLWEWRTGSHITSPTYRKRIATAKKNYKDEFTELKKGGIDVSRF